MKRTIITAAAGAAALLAAPLAASAQSHGGWSGGHDGRAPAAGHFEGRGSEGRGSENRGFADRRFESRGFGNGERRGFDQGYARGYAHGYDHGWARPAYGFREARPYYGGGYAWRVGGFLPRSYWSGYIDPFAYGLGAAPWGYHWVIVEGEALLIQDGTGAIVQVAPL